MVESQGMQPDTFGTQDEFFKGKDAWNYVVGVILQNCNKAAQDGGVSGRYESVVLDGISSVPDDSLRGKKPNHTTLEYARKAITSITRVNEIHIKLEDGRAFLDGKKIPDLDERMDTWPQFIFWVLDLEPALYGDDSDPTNPVVREMNRWRRILLKRAFSNMLSDTGFHFRKTPMGRQAEDASEKYFGTRDYGTPE